MKQNPFSLYDFLGYAIPGLFFVYAVFIINTFKQTNIESIADGFKTIPSLSLEGIVLVLLISYSLGHILNFISSITIERFGVWKYGYPSKFLLGLKIDKFNMHLRTFHGVVWGIALLILLLPIALLDLVLGNWLGFKFFYGRPVDSHLRDVIMLKVDQLATILGLTPANGIGTANGNKVDFFRIVQHFTFDYSTNHQSKFTNYIALYGFLRTMTLLMILLFWYTIVHALIVWEFKDTTFLISGLSSFIAYIFFMAYMKFYRRYTLEGFMALVVNKEIK